MIYAIVMNVVIPARTSVLILDFRSVMWKYLSKKDVFGDPSNFSSFLARTRITTLTFTSFVWA